MRSGELRHRITLQEQSQARNSSNEMVTSYSDAATVWAAIEWGSGRRFNEAKQINAEVEGIVRIRYRSDVKPYWRIKYKDRYFTILTISNVYERGRELVMTCREAQD